jgi:hypothetical protein
LKIRPYESSDLPAVRAIFDAQQLGYSFPDLEKPTYFIRLVGERDGRVVQAAFAHLTAEIYFLLDRTHGTPQERHLDFMDMQEVGRELAWKPGGLDDLHAFLPPQLERAFGKRLMAHGWKKALWAPYFAELETDDGSRTSSGS